jgi:CheY-like chemotaxis protein
VIRKKVLWIEDDAFNELGMLATPVHLTGEFELDYALSATEAIDRLQGGDYDAIVVDVRIPPGDDKRWIDIYYNAGASNKAARLGVWLLQDILGHERVRSNGLSAAARDRQRYGVLSMDAEDVRAELEPIGVTRYRKKTEGPGVLLTIIRDILKQRLHGDYV